MELVAEYVEIQDAMPKSGWTGDAHSIDQDPERERGKWLQPALIAIVDDDPTVLRSLARLMKSVGFRTQAFTSAEDFLYTSGHSPAACLILDVKLPGMDGLELQRQLASAARQVPIIFVSAHDTAEVRQQALSAGAVAFFGKPFNDNALLGAVQSVLT